MPSLDSLMPSIDSSMPSFDISMPSFDSSMPSFDSSMPSFDTSMPSFDSSMPSFDTSMPSFDSSMSSANSSIPSSKASTCHCRGRFLGPRPAPLLAGGLPVHRSLDAPAELLAVAPVEDALREVVPEVLEHDPAGRLRLHRKRGRGGPSAGHGEVDGLAVPQLDAQELERRLPVRIHGPVHADHQIAAGVGPAFLDLRAVERGGPGAGHPGRE